MDRARMVDYVHRIFEAEKMEYNKRIELSLLLESMDDYSLRRYLITRAIRNRGNRKYRDIAKIFSVPIHTVKNIATWSK